MKKSSITSNYIYNLIYQLIIITIPLLTTPYLTRTLGAKNLGIYSYTYSIATIIYLITALGINTYGQREIAYVQDNKEKYSKIFFELIIIKIFSTIISIILLLILILFETKYQLYYQIFSIYIIANFFDISWLYQGLEKFKTIINRNIIIKFLYLISIFYFIKNNSNLPIYIFLFSTMTLLTNLSLWINLKKIISLPKKIEIKKHIKPVCILFIPQVATLINSILDKIMLGIINENIKTVSFYEQSSFIVKTLLIVITLTNTIMISKISYAFKQNDNKKITNYINNTINFIWIIATPLTFGVCAVIKNFVPWFYGTEYLSVINLVYIMSPIIIIISFNNLIGIQYFISTKNQNKYILAVTIGSIVNFILNLILIKQFESIGATIASVTAELVVLLIELYYFKQKISNIKILKNSLKYIILSTIMFIISYSSGYVFGSTIYGTIFQILVGICTYSILLIISKDKLIFNYINKLKIHPFLNLSSKNRQFKNY